MDRFFRGLVAILVLGALVSAAAAGPIADFNGALRSAYADYRGALSVTNTKNREGSDKAVAAFDAKWSALVAKYRTSPPPQFAEDPKWGESLDAITTILARAKAEVGKGDLRAGHASLEAVRELLGDLRARNGVIAYSDRVDAFHHTMEEVVSKPYGGLTGAGLTELIEDVAVLAYLGNEMKKTPPADAAQSSDFVPLLGAVLDAVREMQAATRAGDVEKIKATRARIKPAFGKFFVKFG